MDLREFMSVRRAYNIVRQMATGEMRLTFEELAVLCRLEVAASPLKTSVIAEYQGALRPTMTHRTSHLANLGYIERAEGDEDRRNVVCAITPEGSAALLDLCDKTRAQIPTGKALSRTSSERMCKYVDAMGSIFCKASDLVLLGIYASDAGELTIMGLVDALGLLQPTVSMSVSGLVKQGMLERLSGHGSGRAPRLKLTSAGQEVASELAQTISHLVVRRKTHAA